ncbi:MAG: SMC family ATPase [Lentisphaerae bacterium]|nr:SMC family ATPase [Lentisphaerota bacterium]
MRPLRLTMQAFGPYRDLEILDFGELGPNRVFLIHGDTGAGKTTILDAMVFALYGCSSGGERQAEQMRCELAPATVATEVTFDFALGQRSYRIRRRPTQQVAGVRTGSGLVTKQGEVTLWDRTGCGPDEEGRPLASKIREVDAQVKTLLGFSCDQFRQVVVLPQGRFRELLAAGSEKREEILRQLFRTERFKELEVRLLDRAREVRREMERVTLQRQTQLESVGALDDGELEAMLERVQAEVQRGAGEVGARTQAARAAAAALQAARAAADVRRAFELAGQQLAEVQARGEEVDLDQRRLDDAARAEKVRPAAVAWADARERLAQAEASETGIVQALESAREAEQLAVETLAAENAKQPERREADERVRELQRLEQALAGWEDARRDRQVAASHLEEAEAAASAALARRVQADHDVQQWQGRVDAAATAAVKLEGCRARLQQAQRAEDACRRLIEAITAEDGATSEHQARLAAAEEAARQRQVAEQHLGDVEERWRGDRAALLAATLVDGAPCPVCGSEHHPAPAKSAASGASDEDLERARAAASAARAAHDEAAAAEGRAATRLAAAEAQRSALEVAVRTARNDVGLGGAEVPAGSGAAAGAAAAATDPAAARRAAAEAALAETQSAATACSHEVLALEASADAEAARERLAAAISARDAAAAAVQSAEEARVAARDALTRAHALLTERAAGIPTELVEPGALQAALAGAQARVTVLEESLAAATAAAATAKERRIALQASRDEVAASRARFAAQEQASSSAFSVALSEHGFTDADHLRATLLPAQQRQAMERRVAEYREELQLAIGRLQQARQHAEECRCEGDPRALEEAVRAAQDAADAAVAAHAEAQSRGARLVEVQDNLKALDARSDDIRAAYQTVGVLAETASGQNESRVSFQRWVLGVYLDEVLVAAGRKLYAMSKGRYRFERQREAQSRRRPSGLDIAVFDEFSGTTRPAVTLSGGESFLAALALALGLAETVQEYAAGTPLETIFVDEGFGALDPDALELAVDTLMELQSSGRLVGVISHVAELRQVIPARLEVRGGSGGSHARFVVP